MWAHYAAHHKGMCIGYKKNLFNQIKSEPKNVYDITISTPCKINYDNLRFSDEHDFSDPLNAHKEAVIKHLLKKSDEWIYEKEHRCIIPYTESSRIYCKNEHMNDTVEFIKNGDRKKMENQGHNSISDWIGYGVDKGFLHKKNGEYLIDKSDPNLRKYIFSTLGILTNFANVNFLIDIDEENIESVYFGCKVEKDTVKKYFDSIGKNIKVFHLKTCKKRFELIPIKVNEEYLTKAE